MAAQQQDKKEFEELSPDEIRTLFPGFRVDGLDGKDVMGGLSALKNDMSTLSFNKFVGIISEYNDDGVKPREIDRNRPKKTGRALRYAKSYTKSGEALMVVGKCNGEVIMFLDLSGSMRGSRTVQAAATLWNVLDRGFTVKLIGFTTKLTNMMKLKPKAGITEQNIYDLLAPSVCGSTNLRLIPEYLGSDVGICGTLPWAKKSKELAEKYGFEILAESQYSNQSVFIVTDCGQTQGELVEMKHDVKLLVMWGKENQKLWSELKAAWKGISNWIKLLSYSKTYKVSKYRRPGGAP